MAIYIQIAQILLLAAIVNGGVLMSPGTGMSPKQTFVIVNRTQTQLNSICSSRCALERCFFEDDTDCRRYIDCFRDALGIYRGFLQDCAFGAYWDGQFTCGNIQDVTCNIDYCSGNVGLNYAHTGNCKTFWRCGAKGVEARCCSNGTYFDTVRNTCVQDIAETCHDICPIQQERCNKGKPTDFYEDNNCKTYYNCTDAKNHPVCCPNGEGYNSTTYRCEVNAACTHVCPPEYLSVDCPLKPGPRPDTFEHGGTIKNCSAGTYFDPILCSCGTHVKGAPDNSCNIELDVIFDFAGGIQRSGTQQAGVDLNGSVMQGPSYKNVPSHQFNGDLFYRVMYFQQVFPNLYINLVYQPDDSAVAAKRLVMSNCMNTKLGGPSLELYLEGGQIKLLLVTDAMVDDMVNPGQMTHASAVISVGYKPNAWNRYLAIYNGQNVYVLNDVLEGPQIATQAATKPLTGAISVAAEGIDIGKCNALSKHQMQGFKGSMAELQFTKCLRQEWIDSYNTAAQTSTLAADSNPLGPSPA